LSRDGFTFDTGPSLLTLPATVRDLFLKTGKPIEGVLELQPLDVLAHYRFPDGSEVDFPNGGVRGVTNAWRELAGERAARQWEAFHARAERAWETVRTPFVESPLDGAGSLVRLATRQPMDLARIAPWRSLHALARNSFTDERQRLFVDRYATYTGSDPRRAPAVMSVVPYVEHTFGGWYAAGGIRALVSAIAARAIERGVEIRTGVEVEAIITSAGAVSGVALPDGGSFDADIVISNVDAESLYARLCPRPKMQRRLRRLPRSSSGFVLMLGLRGRTRGMRHHNVLFGPDYFGEMDATFGARAHPHPDPTVYVAAPPEGAPDGYEAWFVLVNCARHGVGPGALDWTATGVVDGYTQTVLDTLARRGFDVRGRLHFVEARSPADLENATASPGGSIYGPSSNGWRAAFLRPANRSPVRGLFLVGGSAHPGGGLPMVLQSAAITAELIGRA
jgi:phytoene desaturase